MHRAADCQISCEIRLRELRERSSCIGVPPPLTLAADGLLLLVQGPGGRSMILRPVGPRIGVEVSGVDVRTLDDAGFAPRVIKDHDGGTRIVFSEDDHIDVDKPIEEVVKALKMFDADG
jgi:hypothetical protein